jgi:hypothetical protein
MTLKKMVNAMIDLFEQICILVAACVGHGLLTPLLCHAIENKHKKRQAMMLIKQIASINEIYEFF